MSSDTATVATDYQALHRKYFDERDKRTRPAVSASALRSKTHSLHTTMIDMGRKMRTQGLKTFFELKIRHVAET